MRPELKLETVAWWNGPNQETEASTFLHFALSLNVWILQFVAWWNSPNQKTEASTYFVSFALSLNVWILQV